MSSSVPAPILPLLIKSQPRGDDGFPQGHTASYGVDVAFGLPSNKIKLYCCENKNTIYRSN